MEPNNPQIANVPEVTNQPLPQEGVTKREEVSPNTPQRDPAEKTHTNIPRVDTTLMKPGMPLSNDIGDSDMRQVPPYRAK